MKILSIIPEVLLGERIERFVMKHTSLVVLTSLLMTACGGGGSGGPATLSGSFDEVPVSVGRCLDMAEGSECAPGIKVESNQAKDGSTVLTFENSGAVAKDVVLTDTGVGHQVSAVLMSNDTTPNGLASRAGGGARVFDKATLMSNRMPGQVEADNLSAAKILRDLVKPAQVQSRAGSVAVSSGLWSSIVSDKLVQVQTQLSARAALPGGGEVKVWVEDASVNPSSPSSCVGAIAGVDMKVNHCQAKTMADMFADKVYSLATGLIGKPWGDVPAELQPWLLAGSMQDINIVLLDITPDAQPLGTIGYFWSVNNFRSGVKPYSNEALVFYMDAATFGKMAEQDRGIWRPEGIYPAISMTTLAHEFQHMIQFYQKQVRHKAPTGSGDVFQNETAAQALGYLAGRQMFPNVADDPHLRPSSLDGLEGEFRQSLGYSGCLMDSWGEPGDVCTAGGHYPQALSLAMYMLHNYGPNILKDWVQGPENGIAAIEKGLASAVPGTRYSDVVRNWGISTRMEKADPAKRLGFPSKDWGMIGGSQVVLDSVSPGSYFNFQSGQFTNLHLAGVAPRYGLNVSSAVAANSRIKVAPGSRLHIVIY